LTSSHLLKHLCHNVSPCKKRNNNITIMRSQAFYLEAGIASRKWENVEVVYGFHLRFPLLIFNARERDAAAKSNARKKKAEQLKDNLMEGPYTITYLLDQAAEQEVVKRTQERVHWREQAKTIGHREDSHGKFSFEGERRGTRVRDQARGIPEGDCECCGLTGHDVPECPFYLAIKKEHEASNPKPGRPNTSISSRISSIIEATARLSIQGSPTTAVITPIPSSTALAAITATARLPIEADSNSAVSNSVVSRPAPKNPLLTIIAANALAIMSASQTPVMTNSIMSKPAIPDATPANMANTEFTPPTNSQPALLTTAAPITTGLSTTASSAVVSAPVMFAPGASSIVPANMAGLLASTRVSQVAVSAEIAFVFNGTTRASDFNLRSHAAPIFNVASRTDLTASRAGNSPHLGAPATRRFDAPTNRASKVNTTSKKSNSLEYNPLKRPTTGGLRLPKSSAPKRRKHRKGYY
jgi:hypothetical protein